MGIREMRLRRQGISVRIDKLTNSIVEVATEKKLDTEISVFTEMDCKKLNKGEWTFNWKLEFKKYASVNTFFKLTIKGETTVLGLLELFYDRNIIVMPLIEVVKYNQGRNKKHSGIAGNLVAYACKLSMDAGFGGYLVFDAKDNLIEHYKKTLNAELIFGRRMVIRTPAAAYLINQYKL